jgi:hypothetical protein
MGSPDGNGSSTGEGRKGALLLLHGRRPTEADGTSERAATVPSSNALRPDSGLNLGWYRPATRDERLADPAGPNEWTSHGAPREADEPQSTVVTTATRVDLRAAPSDPSDSPLGPRRPRGTPTGSSRQTRRRETGLARVGVANVRRLAMIVLGPVARHCRKRPLAVGIAAALLVAVAAVTALEQTASPHRTAGQPGSPLSASQFRGVFLSEVTRGLAALSQSGFSGSIGTVAQAHSGSRAHRSSRTARARAGRSNHGLAARESASLGRSTPVSHAAATSQSVSQQAPSAGRDSATTAAAGAPAQTTSEQQAPAQQTSTQQPVHYQPPAQPAGPAGLGSQVGGNCNPKCS